MRFDRDGIAIDYPDHWTTDTEETDDGWTALFQSPDTAFVMLSLHPDIDDQAYLAEEVLKTLREDYPDLEATPAVESLAGQPAVGHDIAFVALDLTNTAWTRVAAAGEGSVLFMAQFSDIDETAHEPTLRAMQACLAMDD